MIERHAGRQQLVCECGFAQPKTYERDEFDVMLLDAREAGWKVEKIAGAWTHACPALCRDEPAEAPGEADLSAPARLRLSRAKGFDLQAHSRSVNGLEAVNVARPSIFGNPFIVGKDGDRAECADLYRAMIGGLLALGRTPSIDELTSARAAIAGNIRRLVGKNLACWCRLDGKPCHADVLLEIAGDPNKLAACDELAGACRGKRQPPELVRTVAARGSLK